MLTPSLVDTKYLDLPLISTRELVIHKGTLQTTDGISFSQSYDHSQLSPSTMCNSPNKFFEHPHFIAYCEYGMQSKTVCSPGVQKPVCKKRMGYEHKICTLAQKVGRAAPLC
jgi:hypothetical protein